MDTIINRNNNEVIKRMFTKVLTPFALDIKDLPVMYNGEPVKHLGISKDSESAIFSINNTKLAMVNFETKTVSAFGSDFVQISEEDVQVIEFIINKMEGRMDKKNPWEEILKTISQNMNQNN